MKMTESEIGAKLIEIAAHLKVIAEISRKMEVVLTDIARNVYINEQLKHTGEI